MDIGFFSYNSDYGIRPEELAKELESRDFDSFWVGEHTHIPASRKTPFPGGVELPRPYYHFRDPFVSLAAAAAVTKTLKIGTGISLVVQHDPIILAKTVATLDHLSNGRFEFGIGGGWNQEEMENHGYPFKHRWKLLHERIQAMKAIWTEKEASYSGEYINFENIISYPKPTQTPPPPVLMGGATDMSLKRVARYCDGWMPISGRPQSGGPSLQEKIAMLRRQAEEAGRDPASINITTFRGPDWSQPEPDAIRRLEEAGVDRVIFGLPSAKRDTVLPIIDQCAKLI